MGSFCSKQSLGQFIPVTACVTFSSSGALATGTVRDRSDIEIRLAEPAARSVAIHVNIPFSESCEQAFSSDGNWLATVVKAEALQVVILNCKSGLVQAQFSSPWQLFHKFPFESQSRSGFLAGFTPNDNVALWRQVPHDPTDTRASPLIDMHVQIWSVKGELLVDQLLGNAGRNDTQTGAAENGLTRICRPAGGCYWHLSSPDQQDLFMTIDRKGDKDEKATLFDHSGEVKAELDLPVPRNIWGRLVPDWMYSGAPLISSDGQIAAVIRSHVAWVLVDTDRDWGSEVDVLTTKPLRLITSYKTGLGGIGALAVDHRDSNIRVVGFWKGRWHDLRWDEKHPGDWKKAAI